MKKPGTMLLKVATCGFFTLLTAIPAFAAPLNIGNVPLYLTARADPNVLINMSVETPMGGAAYNDNVGVPTGCTGRMNNVLSDSAADDIGPCYFPATTYLGYFDSNKCYDYNTTDGRFNPSSAVINTSHECTSKWSGNFLNWASMTAIDMFIMTMTGGNRDVDTTSLTVIQRARKQNNNSWFPRKVLNAGINVAPSTVTPYADATLYIHNTDWGMNIGTTFGSATGGTPDIGSFNVKVKVCSTTPSLEANCTAYGSSPVYYKPEGLIQRNASQKRFGVMAYTNDNSQSRWGGVLRAPMKHVGPTMPDGTGGTMANPKKEWGADGIYIANPDTATSWAQSGVANYINKFSAPGYKSYDPIGELFYESIRYFKGLTPTAEAFSGITPLDSTNAMTGDFPIHTTWTNPVQYSCQKNFIVAINDANPWLDKQLPGTFFTSATIAAVAPAPNPLTLTASDYGEPSTPDTAINVTTLTNQVGTLEGLNSAGVWTSTGTWTSGSQSGTNDSVGGGVGTFDNSCNDKTGSAMNLGEIMGTCPYPGKQNSYYIAGLAYYANNLELSPTVPGKQNISSFFIDTQEFSTNPLDGKRNMLWLAAKYGGFIDSDGNGQPNLASEWDADSNGQPDNYVLATQPQNLVTGLNAAFADIDNRSSTAAAVALNSSTISSQTRVYQAQFNTAYWSGDLIAYPVSPTTGAISTTPSWRAETLVPAWNSRNIFTRRGTTGSGARGVRFQWPSNPASPTTTDIDADQVTFLKTGGVSDTMGSDRLEFLRGNNTLVPGTFRNRDGKKLGDLMNSAPIYVGKPLYLPDAIETAAGAAHSAFASGTAVNGRTPVVYAGANDGMLHAFRADTGVEIFAYVPFAVFPQLHQLTQANYSHRYYVDGQLTHSDVYGAFANCGTGSCWRSILIGGLGGGGKGIYALDITNPDLFTVTGAETDANAATLSLWELTSTGPDLSITTDDDADLGYTYGQPVIAKMHDGTWRAIFGNGYNSSSEKAVLYLVDIVNPTTGIIKIPLDSTLASGNGLSGPAVVDSDGDSVADFVFAGDLKGNVWKVDVRATNSSTWGSFYAGGGVPKPLFATGTTKPITSRPEVGKHPNVSGGFMVYFGTGQYLQESDKSSTSTQSFYGIWDKNTSASASVSATAAVSSARLLPQTISTTTVAGVQVRDLTNYPISSWGDSGTGCSTSGGNCMGWQHDLPTSGERVVADPLLLPANDGARILYITMIPSNTPCSFGGESWIMEANPQNGGPLSTAIFDINGDGVFNGLDMINSTTAPAGKKNSPGILTTPRVLQGGTSSPPETMHKISGSSEGTIVDTVNSGGLSPRRRSWRQLK